MLSELVTLSTPFIEVEATRASSHQKTYANIVLGRYSKHWEHKEYRRLPTRTASVIDGLLKVSRHQPVGIRRHDGLSVCFSSRSLMPQVDPATRLGGHQRGPESIRVHPFFWGLSWEALESRTLVTVSSVVALHPARSCMRSRAFSRLFSRILSFVKSAGPQCARSLTTQAGNRS